MYQNAGEKGIPHRDPNDPPRRRANSRRGRGSWDNDRPAVVGVAGREHQTLHLRVCRRTNRGLSNRSSSRTPCRAVISTPTNGEPTDG
jgi:hypothetical protein